MPGERAVKMAFIGMMIIASIFISVVVIPYFMFPGEVTAKPSLGEGEPVEPRHIDWLVKELGAGKLQAVPGLGKAPEIELLVKPANDYFTVTIENGVTRTRTGRAEDPDIRLSGSRDVIARLLSAGDLPAEVKRLEREGSVTLEMLRDSEDLIAIGYESLYNDLTK